MKHVILDLDSMIEEDLCLQLSNVLKVPPCRTLDELSDLLEQTQEDLEIEFETTQKKDLIEWFEQIQQKSDHVFVVRAFRKP